MDLHLSAVCGGRLTLHQFQIHEAVKEFDRAMVPQLQSLREFANGNGIPPRKAFDREQSLMLLGRDPGASGSILTKTQKLP